ncbi:MAG: divalent-cation tolerance protein CutA [Thermoanaerobaculia bacterium]|nr:divalent-cation tolerance protein CutA [Thermoanaerobaculia bacterium]
MFPNAMDAIVVVTTVGTEQEANLLAEELLDRRLAACVNIVSGVRSHYRWRGAVCKDSEYLLIIKTLASEYEEVASTIRLLHSYEQPEILSLEVSRGDAGFLSWIAECVDPEFDELETGDEGEVD